MLGEDAGQGWRVCIFLHLASCLVETLIKLVTLLLFRNQRVLQNDSSTLCLAASVTQHRLGLKW